MWSASALLGLRSPLLLYWSLIPHAGQCVMPMACARASTCFLNCLCSLVLVLLTVFPFPFLCVLSAVCCVRWWRVAASARRAPPPSNTTLCSLLLFSSSVLLLFCSLLPYSRFSFLCLWDGVWCVVRAQLCEHARNTPHALCALWVCLPCGVCYFHYNVVFVVHTLFTVNDCHVHH